MGVCVYCVCACVGVCVYCVCVCVYVLWCGVFVHVIVCHRLATIGKLSAIG